jgi:hypothetical protein
MSNAILYNAMAWVLTGSSNYSSNVANYINTWFINPDTAMTPNLNYAQMQRGPKGQVGSHTGILDLKGMTKITSGILMLRNGSSPEWTSNIDSQMTNWTKTYIEWLNTNRPIAYEESIADNNHGTFFYNQLTSLQILVGDANAAINATKTYFSEQYLIQIDANGEQPLEAKRTRDYHYRAYNLAAMITQARIGKYLGLDFWKTPTNKGGNIQAACDFAMTIAPGDEAAAELYPDVAAVAATYGDPNGKYAAFLAKADDSYPSQPYFLWNQPLSDSGLAAAMPTAGGPTVTSTSKSGSASSAVGRNALAGYVAMIFSMLASILF